jgi:hypothetical protein
MKFGIDIRSSEGKRLLDSKSALHAQADEVDRQWLNFHAALYSSARFLVQVEMQKFRQFCDHEELKEKLAEKMESITLKKVKAYHCTEVSSFRHFT